MPEIILNDEQAQIMTGALETIVFRDSSGRVVRRVEPVLTKEMIAELKRRAAAPGPRYTGDQVQARLQALQKEWDRSGGFDEKRMREMLAELNAADPGHERRRTP